MINSRRLIAAVGAIALVNAAAGRLPASIVVADSVNATDSPISSQFGIGAIGWLYTPSFAYDLVGVDTKFSSADSRTVTLEIYSEHPSLGGGTLLRSATFTPLANVFSGGVFASLALAEGEDYFVGFRNVQGLGNNFSGDFPNQLLTAWVDRDDSGDYEESAPQLEFRSPILQFYTQTAAVPAPSSFTVFGVLIAMVGCRAIRRPASAREGAVAN